MDKKKSLVSLVMGFFIALIHYIISSIHGSGPDLGWLGLFLYGMMWACGLYALWNLALTIKGRIKNKKNSWNSLETKGVFLQILSLPALLIADMITMVLLPGAEIFMRIYALFVVGVLVYAGVKIYRLGDPLLGSANIFWGCALLLFLLSPFLQ